MSRILWPGLAVAFAACSIPNTAFHASPDGNGMEGQQLVVSTTNLMVQEGMTSTFDVSLKYDPEVTVGVTVDNNNPVALPSNPGSFTFTGGPDGTWATPVRVTVAPPIDTNAMAETAVITMRGAGAPDVVVTATVSDPTVVTQYGFPAPPAFTANASLAKGSVIAYKVPVPATTNLDSFGVFIPAGAGDYRMALYSDTGGVPGALVAEMPVRQAIVAGPNTGNVSPDPVLPVGTYWLAIRIAQTTAVGQSPSITGSQCFTNLTIPSIDAPWPNPFGAASCQPDNLMNLWINTYHQ
jgi:hypothetical protein